MPGLTCFARCYAETARFLRHSTRKACWHHDALQTASGAGLCFLAPPPGCGGVLWVLSDPPTPRPAAPRRLERVLGRCFQEVLASGPGESRPPPPPSKPPHSPPPVAKKHNPGVAKPRFACASAGVRVRADGGPRRTTSRSPVPLRPATAAARPKGAGVEQDGVARRLAS